MPDEDTVIDVEAVEIPDGGDNLPAVIPKVHASNCPPIELPNRQDTLLADNPGRRCVATNSRGERCRKFAIYGATVCRTHGGATKQVKNKARIRVENASNRLMGKLIEFAYDDTKPPDVQLRAIQNALDRAGLKPPAEVVVSPGERKPYEELFEGISPMTRAESRRARGLPEEDSIWPAAGYAEGVGGLPPTHSEPDLPNQPQSQQARRESVDPTTDHGGRAHQGDPAGDPSSTHTGEQRAAYADLRPHTVRRPHPPHITGDEAIAAANAANRAIGAMPDQRAIETRHKRYPRP
jgi:hypothetical protein